MGRESKCDAFGDNDVLMECLISQWFDYCVLFIDPAVESKTSTELVLQVCFKNHHINFDKHR